MRRLGMFAALPAAVLFAGAAVMTAASADEPILTKAPVVTTAPGPTSCDSVPAFFLSNCQLAWYGVRFYDEAWYWDMNDNNRAWTKRWQAERPGKIPTSAQAGVYSAVTHYLKTVEALKFNADGRVVAAKMKEIPTDDRLYGKGIIRADGRKIHDMYLFEVKTPDESRYFGDFYKLRATIPSAEAFRPLKDGGCTLVNG
jgi:substrate-binding family protein